MDSMVLLEALARLAPGCGWVPIAMHCNHGLRGRSADLDAEFVERACRRLGLEFRSGQVDVRAAAKAGRHSIEMTARRLRHGFLAETARAAGSDRIVLAHHADDQAELVLLRLLRGSGSEGLGGMRPVSPSPADPRIKLLRPFLRFTRAEIAEFGAAQGIRHREDRSNRDLSIPRNRVRHTLLPYLVREHSPALPRILTRVAEIAAAESDFLREEAVRWRRSRRRKSFARLPLALQRIVLRQELWELGHDADFEALERLRLRRLEMPAPEAAARPTGRQETKPTPSGTRTLELDRDGDCELSGRRLHWQVRKAHRPFAPGSEQLDAESVGPSGILRHRRPGDRFQSLGMAKPARLQNLLINRKVPVSERSRRLVLETPDGVIAWVEGFPPGERFRITVQTRRILVLKIPAGD